MTIGVAVQCDDGSTDPITGPIFSSVAPAILEVDAEYVDSLGSLGPLLRIRAMFSPGLENGEPRPAPDLTLRIMGFSLESDPIFPPRGPGVHYEYEMEVPVDPADLLERPMSFEPPEVQGLSPDYGPVRWSAIARVGPDTLFLDAEEDLRLAIETSGLLPTPTPGFTAGLVVLTAGDRRVLVHLDQAPDEPVIIQRELLPEPEDGVILARLRSVIARGDLGAIPSSVYAVNPGLATEIYWVVSVDDQVD
ncbi:MAG: hypothetical protein ACREMK_02280 [Gemmatimonadota bacterium]